MAGIIMASAPVLDKAIMTAPSSSSQGQRGPAHNAVTTERGYNPVVLDHFVSPRNVGSFEQGDPQVGTATAGSRDEGAIIRMQIRVDESGIINDICFKAYGCGATIAAASWVTEWAKGKRPEQISDLHNTLLIQALSLPPVKTHCAMLAEDAIKAAADHYMQRQE